MIKKTLVLFFFLISLKVFAVDIYVDQSAPTGGNGLSWATAFQDIQSAVNAASSGDQILIAQGIYQPSTEIDINIPLTLIGGFPAGGGIQNSTIYTTQIQADFDPVNLIAKIFDISTTADFNISGIAFFNCRIAIESNSNLFIHQVSFDQILTNAVRLTGVFTTCKISDSLFTNIQEESIRGFGLTLQNFDITRSTFENNMDQAISIGTSTINTQISKCNFRGFDTTSGIINLGGFNAPAGATAVITDIIAENNTLVSGAVLTFNNIDLTLTNSIFNNNSGEGTINLLGNGGNLMMDQTRFTNNTAISVFPKPVMGMRNVEMIVTNCLFENNSATGSGPYVVGEIRGDVTNPTVTFRNCDFINNTANGSAASILQIGYGAYAIVDSCVFDANNSNVFMGINSVNPIGMEITNNTFKNHTLNEPLVYMYDTTNGPYTVELSDNIFLNNVFTPVEITRFSVLNSNRNTFIGDNIDVEINRILSFNSKSDYYRGNSTGGIFLSLGRIDAAVENIMMISEQNGGSHLLLDSANDTALNITNGTFTASDLATTNVSVRFNSILPSTLHNSIIWSGSNNLTQSGFSGNTSNLTVNHSLVKGENPAGTGNLNGTLITNEPIFVNPTAYDFRMQRCSPTVNAGLNSYTNSPIDLGNNPRIFETTIDLGAYELQIPFNATCIVPPIPNCTSLLSPLDGSIDVPLTSNIVWNAVSDAIGYNIQVGTTAGNNDIVDVTLGNTTSYNFSNLLPAASQLFVTITPINGSGNAINCTEESFFTASALNNCTNLSTPLNGATAVMTDTDLTWNPVANATGYIIEIGTISGSSNLISAVVNANVTTYNIPFDLPDASEIFVKIIPFNELGEATGCVEESFFTDIIAIVPPCTSIISPLNNAMNVPIDTDISWNPEPTATGYFISLGTAPGLTDVLNNFDNGNSTVYNPPTDFTAGGFFYVIITPYNTVGNAIGCTETSFMTLPLAGCSTLTSPVRADTNVPVTTNLTWDIAINATGYRIRIGTFPGAGDILPDTDVGNTNTYNPTFNLPYGTVIYVKITPYNSSGSDPACSEEEFTTEIIPVVPSCTSIIAPMDNAIDVAIDTDISWNAVATTTGYFISIGTAPGLTDVLNNFDNGNAILYNPPVDFAENTTFYVTITPYNAVGNAVGCAETSFTTEIIPVVPPCTTNIAPMDNAVDVAIDTDISWNAVATATGYFISIGTAPGLTDVLNNFDNGNATLYNPPVDFAENTTFYVTITPYNAVGNAAGCAETSFTTEIIPVIPPCTSIIAPVDNAIDVAIDTDISWNPEPTATGYFISIGTAPGLTDVLNNFDNGNATLYNPPVDFAENTTFYVTITPYNAVGNAAGCAETSFTTEIIPVIPPCTSIIAPVDNAVDVAIDTDISWNAVATAMGYFISIGTAPGLTDVLNNFDNGNATLYNPPVDFAENTTFYVTITPYNAVGNAVGCTETSFTTETILVVPPCTTIIAPMDNAVDVAIDTDISWNPEPTATGYFISIGTAPGLNDVLNNFDNGNATLYNPPVNFLENATYYVTITPYNAVGNAVGCAETSFTTEIIPVVPPCTTIIAPMDNAVDVAIDTDISWNAVATATGYFISIGTAPGLTDVLNNFDNGNATLYNPPVDFAENITFYVTITPYNAVGNAAGCAETSFTTEIIPVVPPCTTIIVPLDNAVDVAIDNDISWNPEPTATGYFISIGTAPGLTDVLNNFGNGNATLYNPPADFIEGTTYYVTIIPYNAVGNAVGCTETSFTTEIIPVIPPCATIIAPVDNAIDVAVDTFISWNFSPGATGYIISIGTTPNGTDVLNNFDNGSNVSYGGNQNLPEGTILYVTITPYNGLGNAVGCTSTRFTTRRLDIDIPKYFTPNQDGFNDLWEVKDPTDKIEVISIFDRYGKLLLTQYTAPYLWDGIFNNNTLPSSDYWYQIKLNDGTEITGHFTLKR
ncbi:MAG: T9SS type B sorting domain-containing protein [Nonlabens sp.]|uniref:T9SS type B sorting domain-containing protein n=1 Tax=Nonlabens sp. TaxID=1888209 RepID=UPI003EF88BF8